jgi:predicted nucleic acid-binding protein
VHGLPSDETVLKGALDLTHDHQLDFWDAIILFAAASARCHILLFENMHDGFVRHGTAVCNPFAEKLHPLLASALED